METMYRPRCPHCMAEIESMVIKFCPKCGKKVLEYQQPSYCLRLNTLLHGKYLIGAMLGQGGFGITYVGLDTVLDSKIAIKEFYPMTQASRNNGVSNNLTWSMSPIANQDPRAGREGFLREARKMAKVSDISAVVHVHDTFEENNTAYIVMEFVEGETLKDRLIRTGFMSMRETVNLLRPVIAALDNVHRQGLIHRDISPDNIMIQNNGRVRILDLGAAKELDTGSQMTSQLVAKKGFSPVEQYASGTGKTGPASDVYSMCVTIYVCVTGKMPPDSLDRIDVDPLTFPSDRFTPAEAAVLAHGMAVLKDKRIQTMNELLNDLDNAMDSGGTDVKTDTAHSSGDTPHTDDAGTDRSGTNDGWSGNSGGGYSGGYDNAYAEGYNSYNPKPDSPEGAPPWLVPLIVVIVIILLIAIAVST